MNKLTNLAISAATVLAVPAAAAAQAGTIALSAEVGTVSSVVSEGPLAFGELAPGTNATVGFNDATAGFVEFETNSNYTIALVLPTVLDNVDAADDLAITFTCGSSATTTAGTATAFTCGDGLTDAAVSALQTVVVWLGGTVTVPATAMAGTYDGEATVTMTLN